ncbi:hypothetical protein F5H01DRAFT_351556 [Linnemannia elongata]|nr:hypothetical protein F5H01DRAFT_351556 [Linnemannia elongata]
MLSLLSQLLPPLFPFLFSFLVSPCPLFSSFIGKRSLSFLLTSKKKKCQKSHATFPSPHLTFFSFFKGLKHPPASMPIQNKGKAGEDKSHKEDNKQLQYIRTSSTSSSFSIAHRHRHADTQINRYPERQGFAFLSFVFFFTFTATFTLTQLIVSLCDWPCVKHLIMRILLPHHTQGPLSFAGTHR